MSMERKTNRSDNTLNTLSAGFAPIVPEIGADNYVILLEDLEFCIEKQKLQEITDLHNGGWDFQDIAKQVKRNPYEVLLALIHQTKRGSGVKPLAFRKKVMQ